MTRKVIENKIKLNNDRIKQLEIKNRNLYLKSLEVSDRKQQYSEHEIEIEVDGNKEIVVMGKLSYVEKFLDEDTGKHIEVQRSYFVKRNGIWLV